MIFFKFSFVPPNMVETTHMYNIVLLGIIGFNISLSHGGMKSSNISILLGVRHMKFSRYLRESCDICDLQLDTNQ